MGELKGKFVDVTGRRPSGWLGRLMYRHPLQHYATFRMVLDRLRLAADDVFLEIGCGGGVMLKQALGTVKHAVAVDYSEDMVALARDTNRRAVEEGRAQIVQADAEALPLPDDTFTCAAAAEMFFFVEKPMRVLRALHRVLKPGGRLVIATMAPVRSAFLRSLMAPWIGSMYLYTDEQMREMLQEAGFEGLEVETLAGYHQICYAEKPR